MDAGEIIDEMTPVSKPGNAERGLRNAELKAGNRTDLEDQTDDFADSSPTALPDGGDVGCDTSALIPIHSSSPRPASSPAGALTTAPKGWAGVEYWSRSAANFSHAAVASQVMAGFELLELKRVAGIRRGANLGNQRAAKKKQNPHDAVSVFENQLPHDAVIESGQSWDELVREYARVSVDTASRWMAMADACRPRIKRMSGADRLVDLLQMPPSQWTMVEAELVCGAVHKLSDGKTQMEFMLELGITKMPQGAGAKGGARPPAGKKDALQALAEEQAVAREEWAHAEQLINDYYQVKFCVLNDAEVEAQCGSLEMALQARRKWLARPVQDRDVAEVRGMFKRA